MTTLSHTLTSKTSLHGGSCGNFFLSGVRRKFNRTQSTCPVPAPIRHCNCLCLRIFDACFIFEVWPLLPQKILGVWLGNINSGHSELSLDSEVVTAIFLIENVEVWIQQVWNLEAKAGTNLVIEEREAGQHCPSRSFLTPRSDTSDHRLSPQSYFCHPKT